MISKMSYHDFFFFFPFVIEGNSRFIVPISRFHNGLGYAAFIALANLACNSHLRRITKRLFVAVFYFGTSM